MLVSKWGNDLAVRLSADDVARLGLKEGDVVDVEIRRVESSEPAEDVGKLSPEEWLKRMERFSGMMPATATRRMSGSFFDTNETHQSGLRHAERHGFSIYDSFIVAAAPAAGCDTLWSEDMQHGMVIEQRLRIANPFVDGPVPPPSGP